MGMTALEPAVKVYPKTKKTEKKYLTMTLMISSRSRSGSSSAALSI